MHWLLQENICQEQQWNAMVDHIKKRRFDYSVHKVVPFSGELIPDFQATPQQKVWVMGSVSLGTLCKRRQWSPGMIAVPDLLECAKHWDKKMLNWDSSVFTLEQIARDPISAEPDTAVFVRPVDDSKFIPGQIMTEQQLISFARSVVDLGDNLGSNVNKDSQVILTKPKQIQQEVRFWIVGDQIATYSMYKLGRTITYNRHMVDSDFIWFAKTIAAIAHPMVITRDREKWIPASAYCLDLCRDQDDQIKIVEINTINSSGLYDCEVDKLIDAINMEFNK